MSEILSIELDAATIERLNALSRRSKRPSSLLAAEAIAAYVESEEWQSSEIQTAIGELDNGAGIRHEDVAKWLKTWGKEHETEAPR